MAERRFRRMSGWRCKIGAVVPIDNAVIEPEWYSMAPAGVSVHGARLHTMALPEMPADAETEAANLGTMGADVIAYACNASSFHGGPGSDGEIADLLADAAGVPATTASTAMVRALDALDVGSVAVVSPYAEDDQRRLEEFLAGNGIDVTTVTGLGLAADEAEDLAKVNEETAEDTYERVRAVDRAGAEAVLVTSTNVESVRTIEAMEADLDCPVVTTNQALFWDALQIAGVAPEVPGYGRLLESV